MLSENFNVDIDTIDIVPVPEENVMEVPENDISVEENLSDIIDGDSSLGNTVSGNVLDIPFSVSGNMSIDNLSDYEAILTDIYVEVQTLQKEDLSIWEKKLEDYTVSEGLLLIIFVILLAAFIGGLIRKGLTYV